VVGVIEAKCVARALALSRFDVDMLGPDCSVGMQLDGVLPEIHLAIFQTAPN